LIYFGSQRGITRFDPQKIIKNNLPPPVYITDVLRLNPKGEIISNVTYSEELILEHNEYFLSLDYAAINYNRSEKNQYAYMLEGFDDKWNYTSKKTPAVYTNLKHGAYTFKVKAANNDGIWNEEGAVLRIIKRPAYWETWWFLLLSVILGILMIYVGFKFYTKNITEKNRALSKYNEELNSEISQRKIAEAALQEQKLDLKEANEHLARSNEDLEQFAYIASHDLQEPLGVVGNFVGLLKSRYKDKLDAEGFQYIDFAVDGVSRMSEQIKSILTFSRVSQNEMKFELTNLNELIATNLHDLSQKIKEKNVQFEVDDLPEIYCDRNLIKICFNNLISNGIKFNKNSKPVISIQYHEQSPGNTFKFSVKDNGIGINQAHQQEIFEIFKRLYNKNDYGGTGIGLSLCKRIIQRHGGDIWVESKVGEGTTFYFTLTNKSNSNSNKKANT
jgi:signal transduction histidine kinase